MPVASFPESLSRHEAFLSKTLSCFYATSTTPLLGLFFFVCGCFPHMPTHSQRIMGTEAEIDHLVSALAKHERKGLTALAAFNSLEGVRADVLFIDIAF